MRNMRMSGKAKKLVKILRTYHVGPEKVIPSTELAKAIGAANGDEVIQMVRRLRRVFHIPICSNHKGYYYKQTPYNLIDTADMLNRLQRGIKRTEVCLLGMALDQDPPQKADFFDLM